MTNKIPVEVVHDKLVIYLDKFPVEKTYAVRYKRAEYLVARPTKDIISIMKV